MTTETLPGEVRKRADTSALMGLLTGFIGLFTVIYALGGAVISPPFLGWMLTLTGVAQFSFAFHSRPAGNFIAKLVIAAVYAAGGIALAIFVMRHVVTLSSVVGVLLIVESMLDTIVASGLTPIVQSRAGFLFSALATLLLGTFILGQGSTSPDWVTAILLGVAILINGGTRCIIASRIPDEG